MKWDETLSNVLIGTRRLFSTKTSLFQTTDPSAICKSPRQPPANHSVDNNKTTAQKKKKKKCCGPEDACRVAIKTGHALIIKLFLAFFFSLSIKVSAVALVVPLVLSSHCSADFLPIELQVSLDETWHSERGEAKETLSNEEVQPFLCVCVCCCFSAPGADTFKSRRRRVVPCAGES